MNILPLEFKLKQNGKTVGFEMAMVNGDDKHIDWFHSTDYEEWSNIQCQLWSQIPHDQKCQWTGMIDVKGNKIYFGDILKNIELNYQIIVKS